jgi:gliding motility-associated-like protein
MNTLLITKPHRRLSLGKKLLCSVLLLAGLQTTASAQFVKIGSGTTSNGSTQYPTPYGGLNSGQRAQYLYLASELTAAGVTPGWIDTLSWNVLAVNSSAVHASYKLYVDGTTATTIPQTAGTWLSVPTLRFYNPSLGVVPKLGWNNFGFTEPFYWNGTDNIVVNNCFWNMVDQPNGNASVEWTTGLAFNGSRTTTVVSTTPSMDPPTVCALPAAATAGIDPTSRPNIRFRMHSDPCALKPEAGDAKGSTGSYCYNAFAPTDSFVLSLSGNTLATGLTFQWQYASALAGPWTNLGTATTTTISKKAAQVAATFYRCIVTCVASGLKDTSSAAKVLQSPPYECDCASGSANNTKEKILSVSLNTLSNTSPCSVIAGFYEDYTSKLAPTDLEPDKSYTLTMRLGSCDPTNNDRAVKVFIDFNQNANYEVTEMVYANTYSSAQPNPQNAIGTFLVPATAKTGKTAMRIVYGQGGLSVISSCNSYTYGETQDYAINILPFGAPTVTGHLEVCEHDSVVMNASSPADTPVVYNWTGPGGFTGVGPKITFVDAAPSLSGTYHVTVTSKGITSSARDVEVIVHPKPAIPKVLNQVMCQYESPSKLITDGKNVIWYNVPVGGYGDTIAPTMLTYTPNSATYYLTQTVNGCVSDRGMVTVNVLLKPAPPIVKSPVSYCQLQETDLAAKGENLKWYLDSTGGVPSVLSPIPPTSGPDTIVYYVSQTVNGCESDRAKITVYVYEQPNGIILHTKPYVCQHDTASFIYFGNAPLSYNYKWWADENEKISGGGQGPVTFQFNEAGDKVISLYVNNGNCATFKLTDTITVRPAPTAVINPTLNACVDVPVTITMDTATPNVSAYNWNWDGGALQYEAMNGGPYGVSWGTAGTKVLSLVVIVRSCPSLPIYDTLYVQDRPYAKILSMDRIKENGSDTAAVTGKICSRDTILFTAYHDTTYTYKWNPPYYFDIDTNYRAVDRMRVPAFVRVDVTNSYGCMSADSIYVNAEPCCNIYMPNAFTPNNDTKNDYFKPVTEGRQEIIVFRIMNRWGNEVYESANSDDRGWDGTYGGKEQDMGTYNYYLKYRCIDGNIYETKGDVILVR